MADPTFKTPVCFVATDPSYCVVLDAIDELRRGGRLEREDDMPVEVGNSGLRHSRDVPVEGTSKEKEKEITNKYNRYYDFSRTLGAVLRAFMLTATGLIKYYHPDIDSETAKLNLKPNTKSGFYVKVNGETKTNTPQFMTPKKERDAGKRSQAQLISGNFDRLYPHILIEKKLEDARLNKVKEVSFPGRMLIVDMDLKNPDDPRVIKIHTINTTVRFTEKEDKVIDCPHPSVEYTSERVLPDGPKFKLLKDMIKGYPEIVERWESYDPQEADPGAVQPGEQAAPDAAQPGEQAAPVAAQAGEQAAPVAAQPGEQAAPVAAQAGEQTAPDASQPGEQAAPDAAQPEDEKEEGEEVAKQLKDGLHVTT